MCDRRCGCFDGVPLLRAEAGSRPGGRGTFLCVAKETYPKERRPRCPCPPRRWRGGSLRCSVLGCAAELAAFFELRSNSCGKSDHEACVSFGTHAHPSSCASRRSQQGWGTGSKRLLLRSCAWGRGRAPCALPTAWARSPCLGQAQRGSWGRAKRWPGWSPLPPPPSDRAEKRRAWGERVPKDTRIVIWLAEAV